MANLLQVYLENGVSTTDGLKEIDHYLQENIRFLSTGRHNKSNYKVDYKQLKALGYRSLVNEFYKQASSVETH